ncbi:LytR C-terminal domain-containing protein [Methylotenera sp.]|uniref:LytR C-terminal domain-containing protein n=1 Tax=Methylotenera sp. TaxID=2051956 RepID=UPI002735916C|nr:LytR C-terminal domain-containing protein [Methylotenera sp.]
MMKSKRKIIPVACCVAIMSACTSTPQVSEAPWVISPHTKTSNTSANPDAMYQLGRYYQGQQRDNLAIESYQKAIAADHRYVEAHNGLGVIYARQGKYQEAAEAFKTALNYAPGAAHLYSNMGYTYYLQGQYAEAVVALKQATTLDPSNHKALNNLGLAYAKAGSQGESFQAFAQAEKVQSSKVASEEVSSLQTASTGVSEPKSPSVTLIFADKVSTPQADPQMLALPKNVGIIKPASASNSLPIIDSRVKLVQLAPNVYELHTQPVSDMPAQVANASEQINAVLLKIEVSNGNGVTGMAAKVSTFLVDQGYSPARLTNQKPFNLKKSQIQYRDGHYAEAQLLKESLPESPELIQRNDMRAGIGVRLVLGKDMSTHLAYFGTKQQKTQIAQVMDDPKT